MLGFKHTFLVAIILHKPSYLTTLFGRGMIWRIGGLATTSYTKSFGQLVIRCQTTIGGNKKSDDVLVHVVFNEVFVKSVT